MGLYGIGQSVPREEDPRLLMGKGRYADDVSPAGQLQGVVLRSALAHAVIRSIDAEAARAAPGVLAVLTGAELKARGLGAQKPTVPRKKSDGSPAHVTPQPLLADDRVRFVGQPVAFVVAETLAQAKDAGSMMIGRSSSTMLSTGKFTVPPSKFLRMYSARNSSIAMTGARSCAY